MNNKLRYPDTNSARAKIADLNEKFFGLKIAIIGLGGTGSYILDHVSKTPVAEIHIIDGDNFELHNAFRAPGAASGEFLDNNPDLKKVAYHQMKYSEMHNGIHAHPIWITEENAHILKDFHFVFICVDKNKARGIIIEALQRFEVPFIDTGIDVQRVSDQLDAAIRVTMGSSEKNDHLADRIGTGEREENEYHSNIQISEINSLCASLAVMKWKRSIGYYLDLKHEHNTLWFSSTNKIINEDNQEPRLNEKNSAA
jgi:tRNA A37 threonylcarbamoyladenosine dehydratase